jgi:peptidoglycan/LPS O-acetylase OafA/YrhL
LEVVIVIGSLAAYGYGGGGSGGTYWVVVVVVAAVVIAAGSWLFVRMRRRAADRTDPSPRSPQPR